MADTAVSSFQTLTGANLASGDLIPVIDVSASGALKNSKMTPAELLAGLLIQGNTSLGTNAASGTLNLGTISDTTARPLNVSQTWNNASLTACGLRLSVTDTSSASGSMLMDLRGGASGSTSYFSVGRTGTTIIGSPSTSSLEIGGGGSLYLLGRYGGSGTNRASIWLNRVNGQSIVLNGNASGAVNDEGVFASAGGAGAGEGGTANAVLGGFFASDSVLTLYVKPLRKDTMGGYTGNGHNVVVCGGQAPATGGVGGATSLLGGLAVGSNQNGAVTTIAPGLATGSGTPGTIVLQGTAAGASSSTAQSLVAVMTITNSLTITLADAVNIVLNTTTGTMIGTDNGQKLGLWGVTPVSQPGPVADVSGDSGTGIDTVDKSVLDATLSAHSAAINAIIYNLESFGAQQTI